MDEEEKKIPGSGEWEITKINPECPMVATNVLIKRNGKPVPYVRAFRLNFDIDKMDPQFILEMVPRGIEMAGLQDSQVTIITPGLKSTYSEFRDAVFTLSQTFKKSHILSAYLKAGGEAEEVCNALSYLERMFAKKKWKPLWPEEMTRPTDKGD